ncbi:MAG: heat shock protein DnaJ-like protein [Candidatus Acidoferrum typicum]|nr:heat shock protein DnaJ-like protein [Candidatus Acidoferrum typicum]
MNDCCPPLSLEYGTRMPVNDFELAELRHAYQVLGVSQGTSAPSIKKTYRRLVKRWHPDLYPNGTPAQAEATQMTRLINEAYSAIVDAPLRDYTDTYPNQAGQRSRQTPSRSVLERIRIWTNNNQRFGMAIFLALVAVSQFGVNYLVGSRRHANGRLVFYSFSALCALIYALLAKPKTLPPDTK